LLAKTSLNLVLFDVMASSALFSLQHRHSGGYIGHFHKEVYVGPKFVVDRAEGFDR
jgi:hypothetical protein